MSFGVCASLCDSLSPLPQVAEVRKLNPQMLTSLEL